MKFKYLLIFSILYPCLLPAQSDNIHFDFSGFVDTYHAVRSQDPYDFMSSRSRLRTELKISKGRSSLFASVNSVYNNIEEDNSEIELREVFFRYSGNNWDLKIGKQIVLWGVADGLRLTDIVSPMDYSEFLARDYDDIRIPVNAFRLKYIKPDYNLEFIFLPVSAFFVLPTGEENPWSITSSLKTPYEVNLDNEPDKDLRNSEIGGRFSFYLSGIDFSFSALHTWNKMPVFSYDYSDDGETMLIEAHYNRLDMLGADFSMPAGQLVIRGEFAEYFHELQEVDDGVFVKKSSSNFLLGIDWYAANEWTFMVQYYHKLINDYKKTMTTDKNTSYATVSISKKLMRSMLKLSTYAYIDLVNSAVFDRTSADYALTDQIHLMTGYDWFQGDKGSFSYYKDNSEYWVKAKFSF